MKILLIGKTGQLGWELQRSCLTLGEVIPVDYPELDLSKLVSLRDLIQITKPDLIINAAAYTNVDKAETEPEIARCVNALAPEVMAEEMKKLGGSFIHYSTDFVFDGTKGNPYIESDIPNPINKYGATKLEGEQLVQGVGGSFLIFRTSWVYSTRQGGFVTKVLQWARQQETLKVVDDQIGSPTWARMLAEATTQIIAQCRGDLMKYIGENSGLYHLAGEGSVSRYEWAKTILDFDPNKEEQMMKEIVPAKSSDFRTPAIRPANTGLDTAQFTAMFGLTLKPWKFVLKMAMQ
jgi:dTDP-4-dehydrorhamnose reductase